MRLRLPINIHKGMTGAVVLGLMVWYDNFSPAAWVYLAIHGTYGLLWLYKERVFPDKQWARQVSASYGLLVFVALGLYWIAPFLLVSRRLEPSGWVVALAVALNLWGVLLQFGADAQKYFMLRDRRGLITEGFFARNRNPNYLGELMIYCGFALLSSHWAGWIGIALFFSAVFLPNMRKKDRSLSRYPGFEAYRKRTGLFWPKWTQAAHSTGEAPVPGPVNTGGRNCAFALRPGREAPDRRS